MKSRPVIGILLVTLILGGTVVGMTALAQGGSAGPEILATPRTPAPAVTEVIPQTTPLPGSKRSILLTGTPDPSGWTPQPDEAYKVWPTRPAKALSPVQMAKLPPPPGTPAARLKLPYEYGRFRILPSGGVPRPFMELLPPKPGLKSIRTDIIEGGATKEECQQFGLYVDVEPAGWQFQGCDATMLVWDDGETTNIVYVASYRQSGYSPIGIGQVLLAPGEVVDLVADADATGFAMTLSEVRGVPVVITHPAPGVVIEGPMEIDFVINDRLVHIGGIGIEVEQLIKVAESFIAKVQARDLGGKP